MGGIAISLSKSLGAASFPTSRTDIVADALREAIISGALEAGQRLNLDELSEHFGVSRMPVREAIKQLETEGLVKVYPYRGVEVTSLEADDLEELFGLRKVLEQTAVERAVDFLGQINLDEMKKTLELMDQLNADEDQWMALNARFHEIINTAAGWPKLLEMINVLRGNVDRYVRMYVSNQGREISQKQHWALYDACVERDAKRARKIIAEHVTDTAAALAAQLHDRKRDRANARSAGVGDKMAGVATPLRRPRKPAK